MDAVTGQQNEAILSKNDAILYELQVRRKSEKFDGVICS